MHLPEGWHESRGQIVGKRRLNSRAVMRISQAIGMYQFKIFIYLTFLFHSTFALSDQLFVELQLVSLQTQANGQITAKVADCYPCTQQQLFLPYGLDTPTGQSQNLQQLRATLPRWVLVQTDPEITEIHEFTMWQ